jgi:hypothetical protein
MTNECIPTKEGAYTQKITVHAGYTMVGKTFSGPLTSRQSGGLGGLAADPLAAGDGSNLICPAAPAANGEVGGVIGWDVASGGKAPLIRGSGTMLPVTSGAAVTAGQEVMVDNQGRVIPYVSAAGNRRVGKAHSTVGGAALDVEVELYAVPTPGV